MPKIHLLFACLLLSATAHAGSLAPDHGGTRGGPLAPNSGGTRELRTVSSGSPLLGRGGYHLVRTIPLSGNQGWDYLTLDAASRELFVTRTDHVDIFNVDSGQIVGQITQTNGAHGVALAPELNRGWASDGQDNAVTPFALDTLSPLPTKLPDGTQANQIPVSGVRPDCIVYEPVTKRVFTFNGGSDNATAIDAVSGQVLGTIPLGGRPEFAVADGKGMIYDNLEDKSEIVAIDARTLTVTATWPLAPAASPSGIAMDTVHRRLFSVCHNGMMAVVNADTGQVIATPAIGRGPDAARFDPEFQTALSSNGGDGTLTVVQEQTPQTFTAAATVPTQTGARTMALDEQTHHIFLITARFAPVPADAPPHTRPAIQDGSVVLLEYAPGP